MKELKHKLKHKLVSELEAGGSGVLLVNRHVPRVSAKTASGRRSVGSTPAILVEPKWIEMVALSKSGYDLEGCVTLRQLVQTQLMEVGDFVRVAAILLDELATRHENGDVHGDIQPCSMVFCALADGKCGVGLLESQLAAVTGTSKFHLVGSACFMAPELFLNHSHDAQTDLYAMGCLFYYMLTGRVPFYGENVLELMAAHVSGQYVSLAENRHAMHKDLRAWVEMMMAKNRAERFTSCREALNELSVMSAAEDFAICAAEQECGKLKKAQPITHRTLRQLESGHPETLHERGLTASEFFEDSRPSVEVLKKFVADCGKERMKCKTVDCKIEPKKITEESFANIYREYWFIYVNGQTRGPERMETLGNLIKLGRLKPSDLVWRGDWSDWRRADECSETGDILYGRMMMQKTKEESEKAALKREEEAKQHFLERVTTCEMWVAGISAVISLFAFYSFPEKWQAILSTYTVLVVFVGFVALKVMESLSGIRWLIAGILLPVVADVYFLIRQRNKKVPGMGLMVLGAFLLGVQCFS